MSKLLERILKDDLIILSDYQKKIPFKINTLVISGRTIFELHFEDYNEELRKNIETKVIELLKEYNINLHKEYEMDFVFINRNPILRIYLSWISE